MHWHDTASFALRVLTAVRKACSNLPSHAGFVYIYHYHHRSAHTFTEGVCRDDAEMTPLVLLLLYERYLGTASRLRTYIESLPRQFNTPLFWTNREIAELQYPPIAHRVWVYPTPDQ